jgi:hypothetical protein
MPVADAFAGIVFEDNPFDVINDNDDDLLLGDETMRELTMLDDHQGGHIEEAKIKPE